MAVQEVKLKFSCGPRASALSFCARWNFSVSGLHTSSTQWELKHLITHILFVFNFQECAAIFVWNSDFGEDETLLSLSFCSFLNTGDSWNLATILLLLLLFWNLSLPFVILPDVEGEMAKAHEECVFPWGYVVIGQRTNAAMSSIGDQSTWSTNLHFITISQKS